MRGHNLKLSRLTWHSRIKHDYFSQRIVEYWNGPPIDVVNASLVNSFKGRLDKHWKEFMFYLELPPWTVTSCHWRTHRQKAIRSIKPQMANGKLTWHAACFQDPASINYIEVVNFCSRCISIRQLLHKVSIVWNNCFRKIFNAFNHFYITVSFHSKEDMIPLACVQDPACNRDLGFPWPVSKIRLVTETRLLSVQSTLTTGLYTGPGFYWKFYSKSKQRSDVQHVSMSLG